MKTGKRIESSAEAVARVAVFLVGFALCAGVALAVAGAIITGIVDLFR